MSLLHRRNMMMESNIGGDNMTYKERRFVIEDASKPFEVPFEFKHNIILYYNSKGSANVKAQFLYKGKTAGFDVYAGTKNLVKLHGVFSETENSFFYSGSLHKQNNLQAVYQCNMLFHHKDLEEKNCIRFANGIAVGDEIILVEW